MAQIFTFPRTICFDLPFDDLSLFREAGWRAGSISGMAEVTYEAHTDDFWFSDIAIAQDNGKCGKDAVGKVVCLNAEEHPELYKIVHDRLMADYEVQIVETIDAELASVGQRRAA